LILADDFGAAGSNELTKGAALVNAAEDKKLRRFIIVINLFFLPNLQK
jgi:hypothetical protein